MTNYEADEATAARHDADDREPVYAADVLESWEHGGRSSIVQPWHWSQR